MLLSCFFVFVSVVITLFCFTVMVSYLEDKLFVFFTHMATLPMRQQTCWCHPQQDM